MFSRSASLISRALVNQAQLGPRCMSVSARDDVADVVVVGGGMVGAAVAALLAHNPLTASLRVLVLDQKRQSPIWNPPGFPEIRVSTITPASISILQQAGAWEAIAPNVAQFNNMQVWDTQGTGVIRWNAAGAGFSSMGAVAENSVMQACLLAAAGAARSGTTAGASSSGSTASGTEFVWPASIKALKLPTYPGASSTNASSTNSSSTSASSSSVGSQEGASTSTSAGAELATISLEDGRTIRARLVVAADGASSHVRALAGLRTFGWQYGQRGVVATVAMEDDIQDTAWQRFLPTGPLALLPLRGTGMASIVWSVPPAVASELEKLGPEEFGAAINKALSEPPSSPSPSWSAPLPLSSIPILGPLTSQLANTASAAVSSGLGALSAAVPHITPKEDQYQAPPRVAKWVGVAPKSFPLQLKHAGCYVRPRLALVGDAAHQVHPMAGQGVNLGYGDAAALAAAIAGAREVGGDIGDFLMLQDRYETPRKRVNTAMITAMDTLWRIYGIQAGPFAAARNAGVALLNAAPPLKNQVMKVAMGLSQGL